MKILFADDEIILREVLPDELRHLGHTVCVCADGLEAQEAIRKESFDVLLLDLDMPGAKGFEVLKFARELGCDADAIILTGKGSYETSKEGYQYGVVSYLIKPYKMADLDDILQKIAHKRELIRSNMALQSQLREIEGKRKLIGDSPGMREVERLIDRIAPQDATVVILGDTGTGKELVAREIHEKSRRFNRPFVAVNCGALPENLIESELFGHKKGSFTGADENRVGLLEVAHGGTLFLDEIGELPKAVQAKLLRFLESGEVRRIGENSSTTCDVRVVCATLRHLETMVRAGDFREDLWFRINTFEILLPPLRERKEDIPALISHLAGRFREGYARRTATELFTPEAYEILINCDWPGNVRQLANTVEHALILSDGLPIGTENLPQSLRPQEDREGTILMEKGRFTEKKPNRPIISKAVAEEPSETPEAPTLRDLEMMAILAALDRNEGNKAKAAKELGISLKTLYNKLNQSDGKKTA